MTKPAALLLSLTLLIGPAQAARTMTEYEKPRTAPKFTLPDTSRAERRLSEFKGSHLLVNFWAVWCMPCREEMPSMQRAYDQLKDEDLEMIAIHVGPSLENARDYAEQLGLTFTILVDEDMDLSSWRVLGLPTTFLLDHEGRIVAEAAGERSWDSPELLGQIRTYLDRPKAAGMPSL